MGDDFGGSFLVLEAGLLRIEEQERIEKKDGPGVLHGSECECRKSHEVELRVGMRCIEPSFETTQALGSTFEREVGEVSFARKGPDTDPCRSGRLDRGGLEGADRDGH